MAGYTVVLHSAYVAKHDPDFRYALETRAIANAQTEDKIRRAGGLVFPDYTEADDYAMTEQYRDVPNGGLIARAPGRFTNGVLIDGCPLYIPNDTAGLAGKEGL